MTLIGWNEYFEAQIKDKEVNYVYGRVIVDHGSQWVVMTEVGHVKAQLSGRFRNTSDTKVVVGDWVALSLMNHNEEGLIHEVLKRKTEFARKIAGNTVEKQVQGANFDTVFIVMALNNDFNVRKLERFVLAAWDTGARPVVVLTKTDLCDSVEDKLLEACEVVPGVEVFAVSALMKDGLAPLDKYLKAETTIALFGASGVGKSTLINTLAGDEVMKVNRVRHGDDRGTHTTTHREMIFIGDGIGLIDTPGMRELGIWDDGSGVDQTFSEIRDLAGQCQFKDCQHDKEPGCAIKEALASGDLDKERYESYLKLKKEARFIERKSKQKLRLEEQNKWKKINQDYRNRKKVKW